MEILKNSENILLAVLVINFLLSGISGALDLVAAKYPKSDASKASVWVHGALSFLQKVIDIFSANKAHK